MALALVGCTDAYLPDVIKSPPSYLVVDGFLNAQGVTSIRLTRTYAVGSAAAAPAEAKAAVYVEEENGPRTLLREAPAGTYSSPTALALNPAKRYRLYMKTQAGKEYASDFVPVKITPAIDKLDWKVDSEGLNIYVSAHDASNNSRYYRWDYDETWEIIPPFNSSLEYVNHAVIFRRVPLPTTCWGSAPASILQLEKTTGLSQDVVADHLVRRLNPSTERLNRRYSILVKQQALTKEEYAYWVLLRKNTEAIGGLFDAQPVQLTGNVHCLTNAAETALGFVGAHTISEKRLFIARNDLPSNVNVLTGYEACVPLAYIDLYPNIFMPPSPQEIMEGAFGTGPYVPVGAILDASGKVIAYDASTPDCLDCRLRGSPTKPSFWP